MENNNQYLPPSVTEDESAQVQQEPATRPGLRRNPTSILFNYDRMASSSPVTPGDAKQPEPRTPSPKKGTEYHEHKRESIPQGDKPESARRHVSWGVELEFLVPYLVGENCSDPDEDIAADLAPILRLPHDVGASANRRVLESVRKVLSDAGLPVLLDIPRNEDGKEPDFDYTKPAVVQGRMHSSFCAAFVVDSDISVGEKHNWLGYNWTAVELISPAFWDTRQNREILELAVSELSVAFRLRTSPTAGFHVHVGMGHRNLIDPRTLRRFVALIWACPLLYSLHSPEREMVHYSQCWHTTSHDNELGRSQDRGLASRNWDNMGGNSRVLARHFGRDRWLGEGFDLVSDPFVRNVMNKKYEDQMPWVSDQADLDRNWEKLAKFGAPGRIHQDHEHMNNRPQRVTGPSSPESRPPKTVHTPPPEASAGRTPNYEDEDQIDDTHPARRQHPIQRRIPHIPRASRINQRIRDMIQSYANKGLSIDETAVLTPSRGIMGGVREILAGSWTAALPVRLIENSVGSKATGVNVVAYSSSTYTDTRPLSGVGTVEIRLGSASMQSDWVVCWAEICTQMLTWSRDASDAEYLRVIRLLAWAIEEGGSYDVLDFLLDIGAYSPFSVAEERLERENWDGTQGWLECPLFPCDTLSSGFREDVHLPMRGAVDAPQFYGAIGQPQPEFRARNPDADPDETSEEDLLVERFPLEDEDDLIEFNLIE